MVAIKYERGDATQPQGSGPRLIVHICNDIGGWGAGFVLALSKRWQAPEREYRRWFRDNPARDFELGAVQLVQVEPDIYVANLVGQRDIRPSGGRPPVRYEAIRSGLRQLREHAAGLGASIHMPRIGCGMAGGHWEEVESIVREELSAHDIAVTVYDLR